MTRFKKIAITVPAATYAALEAARRKLGRSRSEVIAAAVEQWLEAGAASTARRRYTDGYLHHPEQAIEHDVVRTATSHWTSWTPGASSRAAASRRARR